MDSSFQAVDSGFRIVGTIFQITQCGGSTGGARGGGGGPTVTNPRVTRSLWWLIYSFTLRFLGVILLGVDKFLANHLHLRYQELVTHRRVVTYSVIFVWASSGAISFTRPWVDFLKVVRFVRSRFALTVALRAQKLDL